MFEASKKLFKEHAGKIVGSIGLIGLGLIFWAQRAEAAATQTRTQLTEIVNRGLQIGISIPAMLTIVEAIRHGVNIFGK